MVKLEKRNEDDTVPSCETELNRENYVRSFARGLDVIRSFNSDHPEQTLAEVAMNTGQARAGVRRILLTLIHLGYVENDKRIFRLTPKVLELGFSYLSSIPFWKVAEPIIENLVHDVKESASISTLEGTDIVYIMRVPTKKILTFNLTIGSRLPAPLTSMGRVLLSGLDDDVLDQTLIKFLDTQDSYSSKKPLFQHLRENILKAREQGWAMVNQELDFGLISIAAPIYGRDKRIIAAMNIFSMSDGKVSETLMLKMLPSLLEAAEKVSMYVSHNSNIASR